MDVEAEDTLCRGVARSNLDYGVSVRKPTLQVEVVVVQI